MPGTKPRTPTSKYAMPSARLILTAAERDIGVWTSTKFGVREGLRRQRAIGSVQSFAVGFGVVGAQEVFAPIAGNVAQDRVDMVRLVLRIVVFDQEARAFNRVVVP